MSIALRDIYVTQPGRIFGRQYAVRITKPIVKKGGRFIEKITIVETKLECADTPLVLVLESAILGRIL